LVRLSWPTWFVLILVTIIDALLFGVFIIWQEFWATAVMLGITVATLVFWFYSMRQRKRRVQYPIVPPEGKPDIYFLERKFRDPYTKISAKWTKENENSRDLER